MLWNAKITYGKLLFLHEKHCYYKLIGGPLFGGPLPVQYDSHKGVRLPVSKSIHGKDTTRANLSLASEQKQNTFF